MISPNMKHTNNVLKQILPHGVSFTYTQNRLNRAEGASCSLQFETFPAIAAASQVSIHWLFDLSLANLVFGESEIDERIIDKYAFLPGEYRKLILAIEESQASGIFNTP